MCFGFVSIRPWRRGHLEGPLSTREPVGEDVAEIVMDAVDVGVSRFECFMVELESRQAVGDGRLEEIRELVAREGGSSPDVGLSPEGRLRARFQLRAETSWQALQLGVVIMGSVLTALPLERDYRHLRAYPNPGACACG